MEEVTIESLESDIKTIETQHAWFLKRCISRASDINPEIVKTDPQTASDVISGMGRYRTPDECKTAFDIQVRLLRLKRYLRHINESMGINHILNGTLSNKIGEKINTLIPGLYLKPGEKITKNSHMVSFMVSIGAGVVTGWYASMKNKPIAFLTAWTYCLWGSIYLPVVHAKSRIAFNANLFRGEYLTTKDIINEELAQNAC